MITGCDIEGIFDRLPGSETNLSIGALNSCEEVLPRSDQVSELDDPSCNIDWCSDFRDKELDGDAHHLLYAIWFHLPMTPH
jgi:hypothetical protein